MTDSELIKIKDAFSKVVPKGMPHPSASWQVLFNFYNSKNHPKMGMGCLPCFSKVYFYVKKYLNENSTDNNIV